MLPVFGLIAAAPACSTAREGAKGTSCDRATECAPGLFCVERVCTDDLSKLDGGIVPQLDAAAETVEQDGDAGDAQAGETDPDAPPPPDTGTPPDAQLPPDTQAPPPDTNPPPDTQVPPEDTSPPEDTNPPEDTAPPPDTAVDDASAD